MSFPQFPEPVMTGTLTIDLPMLERALLAWQYQARRGDTLSHAETLAKTPEQVARDSAPHLWKLLQRT